MTTQKYTQAIHKNIDLFKNFMNTNVFQVTSSSNKAPFILVCKHAYDGLG